MAEATCAVGTPAGVHLCAGDTAVVSFESHGGHITYVTYDTYYFPLSSLQGRNQRHRELKEVWLEGVSMGGGLALCPFSHTLAAFWRASCGKSETFGSLLSIH